MSPKKTPRKRQSPVAVVNLPQQLQSAETLLHELQVHQIELKMQNEALREAQVALEETRDRYVDLYEFAPVGYLSLSVHGLIEEINLTGAKLLNRERQRLLDTRFAHYVMDADQAAWHHFFRQALLNGDDLTGEVELKRNGAEHLVVSLKSVAIKTQGEVTGLRLTLSDITTLKQALIDLGLREDRLQLAKAAADLGVFDEDYANGVHMVDERLRQIWGFGPIEPISLDQLIAGVHPDDRQNMQGALGRALNPHGNGKYTVQFRVVNRSDHTLRHVLANGQAYFSDGRANRIVGTVKDISGQIELEAQVQAQRQAVESMGHQQIALQTAAAIAHEINQPLVSISAYSEAALQMLDDGTRQPQKFRRALQGAVEQSQRAGRSLHELLDFLHQGEAVTEALDLNQIVQEAIDLAQGGICRLFPIVFQPVPELPPVKINRLQVEKVIVNLLQNACEAMSALVQTGQAVGIRVTAHAMDSIPMAQVSVYDSGPGFAPETAQRVFEPFFTTKTHGTGLGLAISRALIEANGGQLWLDQNPAPGGGAIFHFSLPFAS